jgi:hypothetical protein
MDKRNLSPLELIKIATDHAYCAEHLLHRPREVPTLGRQAIDTLAPITSLMYTAFELTLKAYLLHDHKKIGPQKRLMELVDLNDGLGISNQDKQLIKNLARQQAFRKGLDYKLWENPQQLQVFCAEILAVYERLQHLMPIELQKIYQ